MFIVRHRPVLPEYRGRVHDDVGALAARGEATKLQRPRVNARKEKLPGLAMYIGEREREPLLPRNHRATRDRQPMARASVAELEAGLIGERTRPGHAGVNTSLQLHFKNLMNVLELRCFDAVTLAVPASLQSITAYVLLEQECWFEKEMDFLRRWLRPGMTVIDIGANLGVYSLPMARLVGKTGHVFAYEPGSDARTL